MNKDAEEAEEFCDMLGRIMEDLYRYEGPISNWPMPENEKPLFICWAMNVVMEGDGFECLADQHKEDVDAFIQILESIGAKKTYHLVKETVTRLRRSAPADEYDYTRAYYELVERDVIWLKLLAHTDRSMHERYARKVAQLKDRGKNIFDPKEWKD